jgi:hypothetical protein
MPRIALIKRTLPPPRRTALASNAWRRPGKILPTTRHGKRATRWARARSDVNRPLVRPARCRQSHDLDGVHRSDPRQRRCRRPAASRYRRCQPPRCASRVVASAQSAGPRSANSPFAISRPAPTIRPSFSETIGLTRKSPQPSARIRDSSLGDRRPFSEFRSRRRPPNGNSTQKSPPTAGNSSRSL